jgi:hypothetical protein
LIGDLALIPKDTLLPNCHGNGRLIGNRFKLWARSAAFLLLTGVSTSFSWCQTYTGGGIGGQVSDPTGKPLTSVAVEATEIATQTSATTTSNAEGEYLIPRLKPGVYRVTFNLPGFNNGVVQSVEVQLDRTFRLDEQLAVGSTSESVSVVATDTSINYESPEISTTLSSEEVQDLPIITQTGRGRSPYLLAVLAPGTTSTSNSNNNVNNFSLGGGRPVTNEILIDGLPSTNPSDNTYTYTPSPESIEELKVTTTPFSAELGHTGGGVILANTRHGANNYHASLYTYFNNRLLNAKNYFTPATAPVLRYDQNDPGVTVSGPLSLPHLSGRDKTFFFTDLNVTYSAQPTAQFNSYLTPTDLERSGDFSQDTGVTVYDPATTVVTTDSNGNQVITRQPFPGNKIPSGRFDPVGAQIVKYFPEPNGSFDGGNNYQVIPIEHQQILQGMLRVDHTISEKDSVFARYGRYTPNQDAVTFIPNAANTSNTNGWYDNQFVANETHIFGPTASNDFRFGFVQEVNYTFAGGAFPSSLGLTGVPTEEFPNIYTSNFLQLGAQGPFHDRDRSYIFVDNIVLQRGRHYIKFGGDYRHQMYKFFNGNNNVDSGNYSFDNTFTQTTVETSSGPSGTGGFDLADLLLGIPSQTQIVSDLYTYHEVVDSASLYAQDDWKLTPTLTLNLGMRWEFDGPDSEANNQFASFSPTAVNSQTGNLGDAIFAGRNGAPTHFAPNIFYNFLPRVGAEWSPLKNTVLRAGFGAYRLPSIGFSYVGPLSKYQKLATLQSTDGYTPAFQLSQGVPSVPFYQDAQGNPEVPASLCTAATVESGACNPTSTPLEIDPRDRTPYNLVFQFGVERQFGSWFADVDYVGNHGVKLPIQYSIDQLQLGQFSNPNAQALRPFPQYADVQFFGNQGGSNYQSMQAQLQHKWKNGLVITGAYTFSKLMDDVDANDRVNGAPVQNVYNFHAERGIASSDVPQRFVTNYVYQLPFGRGRQFLSETPVLRDIVGGWQLASIVQFQIGQPVKIYQNDNNPSTAVQRPNLTGKVSAGHFSRTQPWFNTAAFTPVGIDQFGDAPRFPLHGPGINRTDASIKRTFTITESVHLDFHADFANVFNHPNFGNPNGNVGNVGELNPSFGFVGGAQTSRIGQLAMKLSF